MSRSMARLTLLGCPERCRLRRGFDIAAPEAVDPGTVMIIYAEGALRPGQVAYDKKVTGVNSGAGDYKPGLVLDRKQSISNRLPLALVGKVYCKVDAFRTTIALR